MTTIRCIFTARDVDHLVQRFSIPELRHEIHIAEVQVSVARQFGDDEAESWWNDFAEACEMAIEILKSQQPPRTPGQLRSRVDVTKLKAETNIVDVVNRYCELRKAGRTFKALCPFHDEKTPSFTVYPDTQSWHCFGACNTGGDVLSFIERMENTDFKGAVSILGGAK